MAIQFGNTENEELIDSNISDSEQTEQNENNIEGDEYTPIEEVNDDTTIKGLNIVEQNDPNKISVTVADKNAPLVILFGPPDCGKTMTLVRLTRFLRSIGYTISPIRNFRPDYDKNYEYLCNNFDSMINDTDAAKSTSLISFMLVNIIKDGRRLCQILEAPGEYYFNPREPQAEFPNYVNTLINGNNRKIIAIMVEPDWKNETDRRNYVNRITNLKIKLRPRDRIVFIYNKVDKTNFIISPGKIHTNQALRQVGYDYPDIFTPFENQNPITRWWSKYRFDVVPFQTGDYAVSSDGTKTFQEGAEEYPRHLWSVLLKRIRG